MTAESEVKESREDVVEDILEIQRVVGTDFKELDCDGFFILVAHNEFKHGFEKGFHIACIHCLFKYLA